MAQALLGYHSEARWLRYANKHLSDMFPYLPQRAGCDKRLRTALSLVKRMIRVLAMDSDFWFDNHCITDSTPVPCGMSRPTVQRSNLAGWAGYGYGYCASHSRFFWGLRLYPVCTPTGMPIMWGKPCRLSSEGTFTFPIAIWTPPQPKSGGPTAATRSVPRPSSRRSRPERSSANR
ncbi:hypothetical protein [Streptomyces sp. NPDC086010]|uniref:hypothetical protein n=1 Tax=Streptomyces sp. NPDC086010 TaxID=3365745 RepID=UPI0037D6B6E3